MTAASKQAICILVVVLAFLLFAANNVCIISAEHAHAPAANLLPSWLPLPKKNLCLRDDRPCAALQQNFFLSDSGSADSANQCDLVFVHIPKTAGTTVTNLIGNYVKTQNSSFELSRTHMVDRIQRAPLPFFEQNKAPLLFHSKRSAPVYRMIPFIGTHRCVRAFAWFRDPFTRTVSSYRYGMRLVELGYRWAQAIGFEKMTFEEAWHTFKYSFADWNNLAVRLLVGQDFPDIWRDAEGTEHPRPVRKHRLVPVNQTHYERALDVVRNELYFVGVMERMRESFDLLGRALRFANLSTASGADYCGSELCGQAHTNEQKHAIERNSYESERVVYDDLRRVNQWDYLLYDEVLRLFEQQLDQAARKEKIKKR